MKSTEVFKSNQWVALTHIGLEQAYTQSASKALYYHILTVWIFGLDLRGLIQGLGLIPNSQVWGLRVCC